MTISTTELVEAARAWALGLPQGDDRTNILELMAHRLETSVSAEDHDRRVTELLAANNALVERRRLADRRQDERRRTGGGRKEWNASHQHHRGGYYRLIGVVWIEATEDLAFHYEHASGRKWARTAWDFFSPIEKDNKIVRRFTPLIGNLEIVKVAHLGDTPMTLFEYMLIANATLVQNKVPTDLVAAYRNDQWRDAWLEGLCPIEAATEEIDSLRSAA